VGGRTQLFVSSLDDEKEENKISEWKLQKAILGWGLFELNLHFD
jgi:hypothetical protein